MSEALERLKAALTGRYTIERELGRGGMATVYLARDLKHDRPVALKVMHPELAATVGPERFLREIRTTARLDHPHILHVLDSGEAAGQLWYTMPYVRGESLRDRLRREVQLPVDVAVELARQVAYALDYAHREGVVHRDLKPENVLLADGQARVADFGVAKALAGAGDTKLTETGLAVGTPAYMAPEQASAGQVDARSDLYALGCVLYEMLAGEPPYTGPTPQAITIKRLTDPVPSVRRLREVVPEAIEHALARALAKVPADRFATAAEFAQALAGIATYSSPTPNITKPLPASLRRRRVGLVAGIAVAVLCVTVAAWVWRKHRIIGAPTEPKLIAVLPFENQGKPEDDYFAEGLADEVRGKLARIPGLEVVAGSSANQYRKSVKPIPQIAKELGVRYLLTGSVRWDRTSAGTGRVRVSPELVELRGGAPRARWHEPLDAALEDVFAMQAAIATQVATALGAELGESLATGLAERPTHNLIAYDAYLKGNSLFALGHFLADEKRAREYFEQAVALDSMFALAWAALGRTAALLYAYELPAELPLEQLARQADEVSNRALRLSPELPMAHLARASYLKNVREDLDGALAQLDTAQQLAPNDPELTLIRGMTELDLGHPEAAVAQLTKASILDPRAPRLLSSLAWARFGLRQFREAEDANRRALALDSTDLGQLQLRALLHAARGDLAAARASLATTPAGVDQTALIAYVAGYGGYTWLLTEAQQEALLRLRPTAFDSRGLWAMSLSAGYWHRGDREHARVYADSAATALGELVRGQPRRPVLRVMYGLALAWAGRGRQARQEADEVRRLAPLGQNPWGHGNANRGAAWVYASIGAIEEAVPLLDSLLMFPSEVSPGILRVDPSWAPLRGDPRFQRLLTSDD